MLSRLTRLPRYAKVAILLGVDGTLGALAVWCAVYLRVGGVPKVAIQYVLLIMALALVLVPIIGLVLGLYRTVIRFGTPGRALRLMLVALGCGAVLGAASLLGGAIPSKAFSFATVFSLVLFAFQSLSRQLARWFVWDGRASPSKRVAIYGAGAAGRQLVNLMREARDLSPVLYLDDDASLQGRTIEDLLVLDPCDKKLPSRLAARRVEEIFVAIPSLRPGRRREILERLATLPYRVRVVPGLAELVKGESTSIGNVRDVSIEDLLGRETVAPVAGLLDKCVKDKTVLVSGGGGSIGSELCRQVLGLGAARLVVLEHSEFALYQIEQQLRRLVANSKHTIHLDFVLGSVTDTAKIADVFARTRIDTVYHAAAYKHVPIVEVNPLEGFKNNVLGTWHLAQAAARSRVAHFVLISSDKAVRPTNVMGATKRMAEIVVQVMSERYPSTVFSMVRFGNVLESSGSVVPLFRSQIEAGGPVTLTHPDVTRYFMTIQEAVQLVIQAGAMAQGGDVFVLDMGAPVRIKDLAVRMIRLSGRSIRDADNPKGDIAIDVIGLRPGEKLFEELLISGAAIPTVHPRVSRVREPSVPAAQFESELQSIHERIQRGSLAGDVRHSLAKWVSGYTAQAPLALAGLRVGVAAEPAIELGFGKL